MPRVPRYTHALQTAITDQIATLRRQVDTAAQTASAGPDGVRRSPTGTAAPQAPSPVSEAAEEIVARLDQRISRLESVRDWIDEDHEFAGLIDSVIGNQVETSMRRQRRFNVVLNIALLIAGWLLSVLATPDHLLHLFHA